jgi:hypothetical protein
MNDRRATTNNQVFVGSERTTMKVPMAIGIEPFGAATAKLNFR